MKRFLSETKPVDWPKDSQKYDIYTNEEGMYELLFSSQQPKAKDFRRHCCNVLFPHVRQQLTSKMKEDHQQAIEEKDEAIALLNDDLKNREHDNVALQAQRDVYKDQLQKCQDIITHLRIRYVDHAKDPGKDNIMIIEKSTAPEEDEFLSPPKTHRTTGERSGPSFIPLYQFHPLTNIQKFICNFACEMTITYF